MFIISKKLGKFKIKKRILHKLAFIGAGLDLVAFFMITQQCLPTPYYIYIITEIFGAYYFYRLKSKAFVIVMIVYIIFDVIGILKYHGIQLF